MSDAGVTKVSYKLVSFLWYYQLNPVMSGIQSYRFVLAAYCMMFCVYHNSDSCIPVTQKTAKAGDHLLETTQTGARSVQVLKLDSITRATD